MIRFRRGRSHTYPFANGARLNNDALESLARQASTTAPTFHLLNDAAQATEALAGKADMSPHDVAGPLIAHDTTGLRSAHCPATSACQFKRLLAQEQTSSEFQTSEQVEHK